MDKDKQVGESVASYVYILARQKFLSVASFGPSYPAPLVSCKIHLINAGVEFHARDLVRRPFQNCGMRKPFTSLAYEMDLGMANDAILSFGSGSLYALLLAYACI